MRVQRMRIDSPPLTWEVPAAIAASWIFMAILALPLGQAIACWVNGQEFAWPSGTVVENVLGLVRGEPGVGLTAAQVQTLPPDSLVYVSAMLGELVVGVIVAWALAFWWRSIDPGAQFGIASRHQVEIVLGGGNLRRRRGIIRPDLYRGTRMALHGESRQ